MIVENFFKLNRYLLEKKKKDLEVRNLQGSPVNKAAEMEIEREKQIDGLRTRPRRGRRGRRPPFFFFFSLHRSVRGKSIRSPGRIRATLTFVHVESEKFPPSIVIHVSLSILTFHTRLEFLVKRVPSSSPPPPPPLSPECTRQVYNFTRHDARLFPSVCDQLFSRLRRCLAVYVSSSR